MIKKLELENPDFLDNLTLKDKKAVQKAIKLYYKDAKRISKAIEEGKMKTLPAEEVYKMLGIADED